MTISVRNQGHYRKFASGVEAHEYKLARWRDALGLPSDRKRLTDEEYARLFSTKHHADYLKRERCKWRSNWKVCPAPPAHLAKVDTLTPEEAAQLITCDLYRYDPPEAVRRRVKELVGQMREVTWGQLRDGIEGARLRREATR